MIKNIFPFEIKWIGWKSQWKREADKGNRVCAIRSWIELKYPGEIKMPHVREAKNAVDLYLGKDIIE